jgi:hypothetical protein
MTTNITGYASLTNVDYPIGPRYIERILPGSFKATLAADPDLQLLANHEGLAMARTHSGTLKLKEDSRGLHFEAEVDEERHDVHNLLRAMSRGDLDQCSFGFTITDQEWSKDGQRRTIRGVNLDRGDISLCNQGASRSTYASISDDPAARKAEIGDLLRGSTSFAAETVSNPSGVLEVRMVTRAATTKLRKCARCGTKGTVNLGNGPIPCPNCGGNGYSSVSPDSLVSVDAPNLSSAADGGSRGLVMKAKREREYLAASGGSLTRR